jgi:Rrf2 family protein
MHITLEADYAVRIVYCLAAAGKRMDAKAISEETAVTLRFSLKILRKLVAGGIVRSFKGIQGGYELAKAPKEISLNDVIETVEGPFAISRCLCGEYICSRTNGQPCKFRNVYAEISEDVVAKLKSYTFDQALPEQPEE